MKKENSNLISRPFWQPSIALLSIVFSVFLFSYALEAKAYTLEEQPDLSETSGYFTAEVNGGLYMKNGLLQGQQLGNQLSGTITSTTIRWNTTGGGGNSTYGVQIACFGTSANYATTSFDANCSTGFVTFVATTSFSQTRTLTTNITFISGYYYMLLIGCNANCPGGTNLNLNTYGSLSADAYIPGDFSSSTMGIGDMYFKLEGNSNGEPFFNFPINTQNVIDFSSWFINLSDVIANGSTAGIAGVIYGNSTSGLIYRDERRWSYITDLTGTQEGAIIGIYKTKLLFPYRNSTSTYTWYARPYFLPAGTATTTYGDLISFNVKPPGTLTPAEIEQLKDVIDNFIYSSSTPWTCSISDVYACVVNGLGDFGGFLFNPGKRSTDYLKGSILGFKDIFPFSTIFNFQEILKTQITSSSAQSASSLTFTIPKTTNTPTTTLTVLTPTTLESAVGTTIKNKVFTALESLIWLGTFVMMILMI